MIFELWNVLATLSPAQLKKPFSLFRLPLQQRDSLQVVIFKPLSYFFEETIEFDVKVSFVSRPVSRLIRWYNKPGDITKEFWEKAIQFHGTFHGLKITNWLQA